MNLGGTSTKIFKLRSLLVLCALALVSEAIASDDPAVFRSDVSMTRVDAQIVDRNGRAVTGLAVEDFVLRLDGRVLPIRNFASENMPIDILLLLDVSGSMEPHVRRIASAAQQAFSVLADRDRVAVMVFDTSARVRLPFRSSHSEVTSELNHVLRTERFSRGTRITSAMLQAADYIQREARPDARRAIVILTDDQTQDDEDERRVDAALSRADAVLSFLQAPYEVPTMNGGGRPRGPWGTGGGGGGWPGGGGIGFPGGGIGFPGGGRGGGGYGGVDPSHSAGTADIARESGGDTIQVDEASALEDTLARLRQRYALYFYLPEGTDSTAGKSLQVSLAQHARYRLEDAEIHYRRVFMAGGKSDAPVVTRVQRTGGPIEDPASSQSQQPASSDSTPRRRRVAVNESSGPDINAVGSDTSGSASDNHSTPAQAPQGGWPSAKPH